MTRLRTRHVLNTVAALEASASAPAPAQPRTEAWAAFAIRISDTDVPPSRALAVDIGLSTNAPAAAGVETPSQLYGPLFEAVQMQRVFPDSKTFADAVPKDDPAAIVRRYQEESPRPGFDLSAFVRRNFAVPQPERMRYRSIPGQDVCSHIEALWSALGRRPDEAAIHSSLLPLPYPYVVPGERFGGLHALDPGLVAGSAGTAGIGVGTSRPTPPAITWPSCWCAHNDRSSTSSGAVPSRRRANGRISRCLRLFLPEIFGHLSWKARDRPPSENRRLTSDEHECPPV